MANYQTKGLTIACLVVGFGLGAGLFYQLAQTTSNSSADRESAASECYQRGHRAFTISVAGKIVSFAELPAKIRNNIVHNLVEQQRDLGSVVRDGLIMAKLNADQNSASLEDALRSSINPSAEEVRDYYEQRKAQFPKRLSFDQLRASIRGLIISERLAAKRDTLGAEFQPIEFPNLAFCPPPMGGEGLTKVHHGKASAPWQLLVAGGVSCSECRRLWPAMVAQQASRPDEVALTGVLLHSLENLQQLILKSQACVANLNPTKEREFIDGMFRIPLQFARDDAKLNSYIREQLVKNQGLSVPDFQTCVNSTEAPAGLKKLEEAALLYGQANQALVYLNDKILVTEGPDIAPVTTRLATIFGPAK